MVINKLNAHISFTFALIICATNYISSVDGKPTITLLDGYVEPIHHGDYIVSYQQPITDYHLSRLRRGYYYVEDGYITAIPDAVITGHRRLDAAASSGSSSYAEETAAVKYKRTHGKRKKLFVPNLFG